MSGVITRILVALVLCIVLWGTSIPLPVVAATDDYLLFIWNELLYAQSTQSGLVTPLGSAPEDIATLLSGYDVYALAAAPLAAPPDEGYGFRHGVWSPDRTQFAYLEINAPQFQLRVQTTPKINGFKQRHEVQA